MPSPALLHPLHSIPRMSALASARPGDPQPLHRRGRPAADDRRRAYEDEPARRIAFSLSTLAALPTLAALSALARCTLARCAPVLAALSLAPKLAHAAPVSLPANAPPTNPHSLPTATTRPANPHSLPEPTAPAASPSSPSTPARDPIAPPPAPTRNDADLKAEADRLFRAGDLPGAATLWAELAAQLDPSTDRNLLIWKALGAWERAFAADHDHRHLCAARDLAVAVLSDHLRQDHRLEFELRLQAIDRALADQGDPAVLCIADAALLTTTTPHDVASATTSSPAATTSAPTLAPSSSSVSAPTTPTLLTAAPTINEPTAPAGRPALIAGAITVPIGAALFGLMTYAILEDARQIAIVDRYDAKNQSVGLTPDEATDARDALARARAASYLTLGSGIAGAALTLTGTALLIHGQRQRRRHLALHPTIAPTGAALTLSGRF